MEHFTFEWSNGVTTSVPLSTQTGFTWANSCDSVKRPDALMDSAGAQIIAHAHDGDNLQEKENYCLAARSTLLGIVAASGNITNKWDILEIECADWDNWFRSCSCCSDWCYENENGLEAAYWSWVPTHNTNLANVVAIEDILQETRDQIELDGEQGMDQAILDQLIAETNQLISITAYNNESRELKVASKKATQIFLPIIIGLIILGVGFYLYKK